MYIDEFVEDLSNCIGFISGDELILKKMRYDFEYEIRTRNRDKKLGAIKWDLDDHCIVILLNNKSYSFDRSELTIEKTKEIGKMINKAYYNMKESSLKEFTHTYKFEIQWNTGDEYWDNFPDYDEYEGTIEGLNDYLNSQLSEEDPPACFDKEAWRELMNGETVYDETGARYSVKLMDNVNESLENAKKLLKENGYMLKENTNELTKQEKYALLYLLLKEQGVKLVANFKDSVINDQEIDFVIDNKYPASIKNGQFGGMSDDLADDPDTIYYAVWFSDDEDDYREETYDINEIIEYVKAGKWNQFVKEELLSW